MRINHNLMALNTYNNLSAAGTAQSKSMEKLSSGFRINRAGDDAAGLAISEKMRAQIKGLDQASRNSQDGISLIQTAEGALSETQSILQRMRELAVQAANDTNVGEDRAALQNEMDQLTQEIDRIGNTTEFNTRKLLNGAAGIQGTAQVAGVDTSLVSLVGGTSNTKSTGVTLQLDNVAAATEATVNIATDADDDIISGSFVLNGTTITVAAGADNAESKDNFVAAVNNVSSSTGVTAEVNGGNIVLKTTAVGSSAKIEMSGLDNVLDPTAGTAATVGGTAITAATTYLGYGTDATATIDAAASDDTVDTAAGAVLTSSGNILTVHGGDYDGLQIKVKTGTTTTNNVDLAVTSNGTLSLQIGANEGQEMNVNLADMRASALGVDVVDISTPATAKTAITTINDALISVSSERAKLGAVQNRLEHTINNLNTSSENLTAAESRIRDVDMAQEMMTLTKTNILQQAAQAMLAQANQAPQGVLKLLQ